MQRRFLIGVSSMVALFVSAGADAKNPPGATKDKKLLFQTQQQEKLKLHAQEKLTRQAEGRDKACGAKLGAGASWSAAQNKCLPPKTEAPKKEAIKGATLPKGGAAPAKVQPAGPRGLGQSCGMV